MMIPDSIKEKLLSEIKFSSSRNSGPGGQNVNKVNTRIELRFYVQGSTVLDESEKLLILSKLKNRINNKGELIVISGTERSQWQNREKGIQKFFVLIENALKKPLKRIKIRPTAASRLKKLENKKMQAWKKFLRKPPEF